MRALDGCARATNIKLSVVGWLGGWDSTDASSMTSVAYVRVCMCVWGGVCVW